MGGLAWGLHTQLTKLDFGRSVTFNGFEENGRNKTLQINPLICNLQTLFDLIILPESSFFIPAS